jgi:hypothetical protein
VQKTLNDADIKLDSVLTDVMGKSVRAMIEHPRLAERQARNEVEQNMFRGPRVALPFLCSGGSTTGLSAAGALPPIKVLL